MSTYPELPPWADDRRRAMRVRLQTDRVQEPYIAGTAQSEMRDVLTSEPHQFPRRRLQQHHRASQSIVSTTVRHPKLQSRPSTAPSPYESNTSLSSTSVLDISSANISPITTGTAHRTTNPIRSRTSSPRHNPATHAVHSLSLAHSSISSDCIAGTPTNPKEQKLTRILRPIKSSLSLARKDSSKNQRRQRKESLPSRDSPAHSPKEHPPLPVKPNVLISPRRLRNASISTPTLSLAPPRVDAELGNLSRPKSRTAFTSNESFSRERALPPLPLRPHTSSGNPSPRLRTLSHLDSQRKAPIKRPTTAPAAYVAPFDENAIPTRAQLSEAASLFVLSENGVQVPFGNLFLGARTVVIFIRHFWCPLCQDYMFSISRNVNPTVLKQAGIDFVIISNGSHKMIKSYRQIFRTPFAVYIDPTHRVYKALGMTLRTLDAGPESEKGGYIRHGLVGGITMVVKNVIKSKMPVWGKAGDPEQLGGEFVLGPGLKCTFAHRMRTTRSHTPIHRVLTAAGVDVFARWEQAASICSALLMTDAEEARWMEERNRSLAKLKEKKSFRRGGEGYCGPDRNACEQEDVAIPAIEREVVEKEGRTVSPISTMTLVADDEVRVAKILKIGQLSKPVLTVIPPKESSDAYWYAQGHPAMDSVDIFPSTIVTDTVGPKSISSCSDSDSCWDYYFEQSSQTDEA